MYGRWIHQPGITVLFVDQLLLLNGQMLGLRSQKSAFGARIKKKRMNAVLFYKVVVCASSLHFNSTTCN